MTPSQIKAIEWFKAEFLRYNSHGDIENCEYKTWDVREMDYGRVCVVAEVGRKNDEGTMASVFCRSRKQVFIGKKGAFSWYEGTKSVKGGRYGCEIYFPEN